MKIREWLLSLPSISWLFCCFFIPACIVYILAFREVNIDGDLLPIWSFSALKQLYNASLIWIAARTVIISSIAAYICVLIAIPVAYFIATAPKKYQQPLVLLVIVPLWSSFLVRIFSWKLLLHPEGIGKAIFLALHLVDESTSLLYNNITVILVMCTSYIPFAILPIYSAASKFNFTLFEAATDLGASRTQAFFQVFLPSIRPAMRTAYLMVFIPATGAYIIPDVIGGQNTSMLGNVISQKIFVERSLPEASSCACLLTLIVGLSAIWIWRKELFSSQRKG